MVAGVAAAAASFLVAEAARSLASLTAELRPVAEVSGAEGNKGYRGIALRRAVPADLLGLKLASLLLLLTRKSRRRRE